jgi:hypothetical protein
LLLTDFPPEREFLHGQDPKETSALA